MIKECIVTLNNDAVTVVKYGDVDVQLPAIHREAKSIFVNYENGKYFVVDKDYKSKCAPATETKGAKKKTTIDEIAKEVEDTDRDNVDA